MSREMGQLFKEVVKGLSEVHSSLKDKEVQLDTFFFNELKELQRDLQQAEAIRDYVVKDGSMPRNLAKEHQELVKEMKAVFGQLLAAEKKLRELEKEIYNKLEVAADVVKKAKGSEAGGETIDIIDKAEGEMDETIGKMLKVDEDMIKDWQKLKGLMDQLLGTEVREERMVEGEVDTDLEDGRPTSSDVNHSTTALHSELASRKEVLSDIGSKLEELRKQGTKLSGSITAYIGYIVGQTNRAKKTKGWQMQSPEWGAIEGSRSKEVPINLAKRRKKIDQTISKLAADPVALIKNPRKLVVLRGRTTKLKTYVEEVLEMIEGGKKLSGAKNTSGMVQTEKNCIRVLDLCNSLLERINSLT